MWSLKYEYRHRDCTYQPMAKKLGVVLYSQLINNWQENNLLYITAIHRIEGTPAAVKKYLAYLKKLSLKMEQVSANMAFTLAIKKTNMKYYAAIYNPLLIYPRPIRHEGDREYVEILCWDKKPLMHIVDVIANNDETTYFKLFHLKQRHTKDVFVMQAIDHCTGKQRRIFEFASQQGYYAYPRKINLDEIARHFKITKSTCHEILRRAETHLLNQSITRT
ncbi:MAG: helix-turn-helix domain-containing protein [Candidatus Woesearchaeota archaeon]